MTIAFVKATKLESGSGTTASGSVTWTAGNALVVVAAGFGSSAAPSVSGGGGTWTSDISGTEGASGNGSGGISSNPNPSGTGATLTITVTGASGVTASVLEFSFTNPLKKDNTSPAVKNGTGTAATSNGLANVTTNALLIGCEFDDDAANGTMTGAGTGFIYPANSKEANGSSFQRMSGGYNIVSSVATRNDAVTIASSHWAGLIAVYAETVAASFLPKSPLVKGQAVQRAGYY